MSVKEVPMYVVVCDEPDCNARTSGDQEFAGFGDGGAACDQAVDAEWDIYPTGELDYCERHRKPRCCGCNERGPDLWEMKSGEHECGECRAESAR